MIYNYFKLTGNSKKRFQNRKLKQQDSNISITNLAKLHFTFNFQEKKIQSLLNSECHSIQDYSVKFRRKRERILRVYTIATSIYKTMSQSNQGLLSNHST